MIRNIKLPSADEHIFICNRSKQSWASCQYFKQASSLYTNLRLRKTFVDLSTLPVDKF
jgi:hypothetical protein